MNLKQVFARKAPDAGFADRVIARIEAEERLAPGAWRLENTAAASPRRQAPGARRFAQAAAATVLLTALGAGWAVHHARNEMLLALRISATKVRTAQQHVRDLGSH